MKKRTAVAFACALALAAAAPALAGEAGKECGDRHGKHGFSPEKFDKMDTNGDGKLSLEEFRTAKQKQLETWYEKMDANDDGAVTKEEIAALKEKHHQHHEESKTE